jgi:hypothetical protein
MAPRDLRRVLRAQPFRPFRIHFSNGQTFDVRHPELAMVGLTSVVVGRPAPNQQDPVYDDFDIISIFQINSLEPLPTTTPASSNGEGQ